MNWKGFFVEIYNLVSKDNDIPQWNESMLKVKQSTNLCFVLFYCYKLCGDEQKDLQWWKNFLRELLDFTTQNTGKSEMEVKKASTDNAKKYQDENIDNIYLYLVLEMVKK